jgi:CRISPR/Cas system Type II protein with McrA/HNH and RuvC-like nuclease domain
VLRDKFVAQDGHCPYSGEALTLGLNAELDHILPAARFPEHRFDPSNVQWVADWVNMMKQDATPEEFLNRMRHILVHCSR